MIDSLACSQTNAHMKILVIAGSYGQYRDYLELHKLNEIAAPFIQSGEQIMDDADPEYDEIALVGTYHDNPAYQSAEYIAFQYLKLPTVLAS